MPRQPRTQYTSQTVPGAVDVIGNVTNGATVLVNLTNPCQVSEYDALGNPCSYYWRAATVANGSGPVFQGITNAAHLSASSSYSPATYTNIGHVFVPETPESYSYDLDGNLTSDGHWNYYWDGENRLIAMTNNASIAAAGEYALTFGYDYQGRRIQKQVFSNNGTNYVGDYTNRFLYDGWNPVAVVDATSGFVASMMWGLDLSGSMQGGGGVGGLLAENLGSANGVHFVAHDGNGNVAALLGATSGTVTANYEYGPFYELIRATGPMATVNQVCSADKIRDPETGFYYYGYRYYNPSTGRWPNRDPLDEQGGKNLYNFSGNDGINYFDPDGQAYFNFTLSFGDLYISGGVDDQNLHFEAGGSAVPKPLEKLSKAWNSSSWRRYHIGTIQAQLSVFGSVDLTLNGLDKHTKACINAQLVFALIKQNTLNGQFGGNGNSGIGVYGSGSLCLYPCTGNITLEYEASYFVKFGNGGTQKNWKDWFNLGGKISGDDKIGNWSWLPQKLACHCKN